VILGGFPKPFLLSARALSDLKPVDGASDYRAKGLVKTINYLLLAENPLLLLGLS
jgi:hypothetical protein